MSCWNDVTKKVCVQIFTCYIHASLVLRAEGLKKVPPHNVCFCWKSNWGQTRHIKVHDCNASFHPKLENEANSHRLDLSSLCQSIPEDWTHSRTKIEWVSVRHGEKKKKKKKFSGPTRCLGHWGIHSTIFFCWLHWKSQPEEFINFSVAAQMTSTQQSSFNAEKVIAEFRGQTGVTIPPKTEKYVYKRKTRYVAEEEVR